MASAILILFAMPLLDTSRIRSNAFRPLMRLFYWLFVVNFLLLMCFGSAHVEEPFITLGQCATIFYFSYFLIFVPILGVIENTLFDLSSDYPAQSPAIKTNEREFTTLTLNKFLYLLIMVLIFFFNYLA